MKDRSPKVRSKKPFILFSGGVLVALFSFVGFSLFPATQSGDQSMARGAICLVAVVFAYVAERVSQLAAGVSLVWARVERRRLILFAMYALIWMGSLKLSWAGLLESQGMFDFLIDAAVMYMFAAALFEVLNLLKSGADQ